MPCRLLGLAGNCKFRRECENTLGAGPRAPIFSSSYLIYPFIAKSGHHRIVPIAVVLALRFNLRVQISGCNLHYRHTRKHVEKELDIPGRR